MRDNSPLHLLELNVKWPPIYQPFITGRLRALADEGVRIAAVTSCHETFDPGLLPYVRLIRLPSAREDRAAVFGRTLVFTIQALLRHPGRVRRLFREGRRRSETLRAFYRWWSDSIPLVIDDPDIVHFEWNGLAATYDWLPDLLGVPSVVSCRGRQVNIAPHLPDGDVAREELAVGFRNASFVHGVSVDILQQAAALGMPREKGRVVYTAVDANFFHPVAPRADVSGSVRLLNVGVAMWRKGYEYLLLALREAVDSGFDLHLEIADYDGPEKDRVDYTISDLGLQDRVTVLGKLGPDGIREALWRADIFVLSALSEGISNAVVEAMSCGVPVVTTDCGGMREAVTDGVEGFIVPVRNPSMMAVALGRLASDPEMRSRMGEAGRRRVERDFLPQRQARQFIALYKEAIQSGGPIASAVTDAAVQASSVHRAAVREKGLERCEINKAPYQLVSISDLDWQYGHEYVMEAMSILNASGLPIRFTLIGDGPFMEAVGYARHELNLEGVMEIIPRTLNVRDALDGADLFVLGSVAAGTGHSLRDAIELGIPAVLTDVPNLLDTRQCESACIIVPRRDPDAMADAIVRALSAKSENTSRIPA